LTHLFVLTHLLTGMDIKTIWWLPDGSCEIWLTDGSIKHVDENLNELPEYIHPFYHIFTNNTINNINYIY